MLSDRLEDHPLVTLAHILLGSGFEQAATLQSIDFASSINSPAVTAMTRSSSPLRAERRCISTSAGMSTTRSSPRWKRRGMSETHPCPYWKETRMNCTCTVGWKPDQASSSSRSKR
jgi:hypothetical protein